MVRGKRFYIGGMVVLCFFLLMGCSSETGQVLEEKSETASIEEKVESQFKPGKFEPGKFEPGHFEPGNFEPGKFEPGTFEPGNFDPNVSILIEEDEIVVEVPSALLFEFDKSNLKSDSIGTLEQLSVDLNQYDGANIFISGHTDSQGEEGYNQKLSKDRAEAVYQYLKEKVDSEKVNIEVKGYGETKPAASNDTEEGREKNRRVEITIEPLKQSE